MPTPEFILRLREKIGHDPLWLIGCTAVVVRPHRPDALGREDALAAAAQSSSMRAASAPMVGSNRSLVDLEPWSAVESGAGFESDTGSEDVLLVRRSDDGLWAPVTGIVDPGEHPAVAAVREAFEETLVECEIERMAQVHVTAPVTHPNGDIAQYTGLVFRCGYVAGTPGAGDDEAADARWWQASALPPMREVHRGAIRAALRADPLCELLDGDRVIPVSGPTSGPAA
ncbi:MAG: NUDIX hydrolase [Gulosibacter sp.]|uniref:NUDIX hydrolase n=1 Tax=Gulosibacter sp. TaxID=2817531 RepID=UPI003F91A71B